MKLGNPQVFLYLIWVVVFLCFFCIWAVKNESRTIERFAHQELIKKIAPNYDSRAKKIRAMLAVVSALLMIVIISRPQWGFYWKESDYEGIDVIMALDSSKSMLAVDVTPNRLESAKDAIRFFVNKLDGDRVGLIAFSGQAFLQCPLTADRRGFLITLNSLEVGTIPVGGTSLASAIEEAIRGYEGAATDKKVLIIITDGENTAGDVNKAIKIAQKDGIQIFCIGIGTITGEYIPVIDESGKKIYVTDKQGQPVKSRLDEVTLKSIAEETGGQYLRATPESFGLDKIYDNYLAEYTKTKHKREKVKVFKERFQLPLVVLILILILDIVLRSKRENK